MKHTLLLLLISFLFMPAAVQGQSAVSRPGSKDRISQAVNRKIAHAREQAQRQAALQRQVSKREAMRLSQDEMVDDKNYVSTPQGDIRKGSWKACEYFYNWDKYQQNLRNQNVEVYESQRDIVLLKFGITENHCSALAKLHQPVQAPSEPVYLADNNLPSTRQAKPIEHQPTGVEIPQQDVAQAQAPVEENSSFTDRDFEYSQYLEKKWSPRKIKRYLREYTARNCNQIQEALELQARGEDLRSRHRIVLTGYTSLCQAYERTLGEPADVCAHPAMCKPANLKSKEEQAFVDKYNQATIEDYAKSSSL